MFGLDWLDDLFDFSGDAATDYYGGDTGGDSSFLDNMLSGFSDTDYSDFFNESNPSPSYGFDLGELAMAPSYDSISPADVYQSYDMNSLLGDVSSSNSIWDTLSKLKRGAGLDNNNLMKLGLGAGLSYLGNKSTANANQNQASSNLANYLSNVTWTPEKSANYMNAVRNNVAGIYGGQLAQGKGTLAEQLAGAGRGGGSYGKASEKLNREMLNKMATATNSAIQTVNTPSNLSYGAFNIPADTSTGNWLTNLSGLLGNMYTQDNTSKLLQQILAGLKS